MTTALRRQQPGAGRAPQRWDPFRQADPFAQMAPLLEAVMSGAVAPDVGALPFVPPVDIEETEDAWIITAELPGASKDDMNVEVNGNEIAIRGEIKERERAGILRRRTRRVGEFEFRVDLPGRIDPNGIEADLDNGVLTVRVPRPDRTSSQVSITDRGGAQVGGTGAPGGTGGAPGGGAPAG